MTELDSRPASTLEVLEGMAAELRAALAALLDQSGLHDINSTDGLVIIGATSFWDDLSPQAGPLLRAAQGELDSWRDLGRAAVAVNDKYRVAEFDEACNVFDQVVNRSADAGGMFEATVDEVRQSVAEALDDQLAILRGFASGDQPEILWLPDTNALLFQPDLSQWPDVAATLVITPAILSELDDLKEGRKGPEIKAKAEAAIGSLNEMGRRGDTSKGVTVHGHLGLREVAVDPDMRRAPNWLRSDSMDDRFIASALELAFSDLAAPILVVTRDRNLKNKARQARISCAEPADLGVPPKAVAPPTQHQVLDAVFTPSTMQSSMSGGGTQTLEIVNLTERPLRLERVTSTGPAHVHFQPQTLAKLERRGYLTTFQTLASGACIDVEILATPAVGPPVTWSCRFVLGPSGLVADQMPEA